MEKKKSHSVDGSETSDPELPMLIMVNPTGNWPGGTALAYAAAQNPKHAKPSPIDGSKTHLPNLPDDIRVNPSADFLSGPGVYYPRAVELNINPLAGDDGRTPIRHEPRPEARPQSIADSPARSDAARARPPPLPPPTSVLLATMIALTAFAVAALPVAALYTGGMRPKLGALIPPAFAFLAWHWARASDFRSPKDSLVDRANSLKRQARFRALLLGLWVVGYISFWAIVQPRGYSFGGIVAGLILVPVAAHYVFAAFQWANRGPS